MSGAGILKTFEAINANVKSLVNLSLLVGIPHEPQDRKPTPRQAARSKGKTKAARRPLTNAEIGYYQEFGTVHIPARPFLMPTIVAQAKDISMLMQPDISLLRLAPSRMRAEVKKRMRVAGLYAQGEVRRRITDQVGFKALSPKTIEARRRARKNGKAGTKALIDTGQLRTSINFVITEE